MTTKRYALVKGDSKRVRISWGLFFSNVTIRLDEQVIGTIGNRKELNEGRSFRLTDGSELTVFQRNSKIHIERDGRPLPGSPDDPQIALNWTIGIFVYICIANVFGGLSGGGVYNSRHSPVASAIVLGIGVLYGFLAYLVSLRIQLALWIGLGIYILDAIASIFLLFGPTAYLYVIPIIVHVILLVYMWRGFRAIDRLNAYNVSLPKALLQPLPAGFPGEPEVFASDKAPFELPDDSNWMPTVNPEQLLREAVEIIKHGGEKQNAKTLVNEALRINSKNPNAWYLSGYLADTKSERKAALERTLALNPNHTRARQELDKLLV